MPASSGAPTKTTSGLSSARMSSWNGTPRKVVADEYLPFSIGLRSKSGIVRSVIDQAESSPNSSDCSTSSCRRLIRDLRLGLEHPCAVELTSFHNVPPDLALGSRPDAAICSTAAGFSSEVRSPVGRPRYAARITRRMILALRVLGRSATKSTALGRIEAPSWSRDLLADTDSPSSGDALETRAKHREYNNAIRPSARRARPPLRLPARPHARPLPIRPRRARFVCRQL